MNPTKILSFWFEELKPADWFSSNPELDETIRRRFLEPYAQACACEYYSWRATPEGRLAEIILLDQLPRNMFRNHPLSFAADSLALTLAQEAVAGGHDAALAPDRRRFLYMPYMHSESRMIHAEALRLFTALGHADALEYEKRHKIIIDRFGRYPHRNAIMQRNSTPEEIEFLKQPGSRF